MHALCFVFIVLCVLVFCLHARVRTMGMSGAHGSQKEVLDSLVLRTVVNHLWVL